MVVAPGVVLALAVAVALALFVLALAVAVALTLFVASVVVVGGLDVLLLFWRSNATDNPVPASTISRTSPISAKVLALKKPAGLPVIVRAMLVSSAGTDMGVIEKSDARIVACEAGRGVTMEGEG